MNRMSIFKLADMKQETLPAQAEVIQESSMHQKEEPEEQGLFTKSEIREALPPQLRSKVTDSLLKKLNDISQDPDVAKEVRNNFVGFNNVMKDGKFKFEDYLNACAYSTFKMMGHTNQQAWGLTFPDKLAKMRAENRDENYISAFVASFSKGKLVNIILEQAMIPSFVLNQDLYQKALNICAGLMVSANSEKVQVEAAKAILEATRAPERSQVQLDISIKDNSGLDELKELMQEVAGNQIKQIESGTRTRDIAHQGMFPKGASE